MSPGQCECRDTENKPQWLWGQEASQVRDLGNSIKALREGTLLCEQSMDRQGGIRDSMLQGIAGLEHTVTGQAREGRSQEETQAPDDLILGS